MYTPLYSALLELKNKNQLSFHMPGHFDGKAMSGFGNLLEIDTTEVPESDNLFLPTGPIAQAQAAAARFFGARETRFLVNGSSGGIMSMVSAVVSEGQKIICDRFCHRSFISALITSGAEPVWIYPEIIDGGLMWGGIDPDQLRAAIEENPDAVAVYLTSPNYFGLSSDLQKIAEITHEHNMPLLVDAAHGAHYGLSPLLPPSAAGTGADMAVVSAHKTLPSVTQSSYLHINGDFPRLDQTLKMYQTSSPSYILMSSLDYARALMERDGLRLWTELAENALKIFPEQINLLGKHSKYKDPCRLVLPTSGNPFETAEILRLEYGISVECCYGGGVVCIVNTAHSEADLMRLRSALEETDRRLPHTEKAALAPLKNKAVLTPRQAFFAPWEEVSLEKAVQRVCAREIVIYPPGTAQLIPGELITAEAIEEINRVAALGGEVHGVKNGKIAVTAYDR